MPFVRRRCLGERGVTCFLGGRTGVLSPGISTMETLTSGQLYLQPPSPCFNSHTNSVFSHPCKRTFSLVVADTFRVYKLDFSFVFKLP